MGGVHQPFLYEAEATDSRFPESTFDPKAVTRASWERKPPRPRQDGPLVSFNRHPEYADLPSLPAATTTSMVANQSLHPTVPTSCLDSAGRSTGP